MNPALVTGAILAGGRSRRMGRDKALITVRGKPLIQLVVDCVREVTDEVFICSDERAKYSFLNLPVIEDVYKVRGPLAGLHAALASGSRPLVLLLACDLPNIHPRLLENLLSFAEGHDAVVPCATDGRPQPLCALYRRSLLPLVSAQIEGEILEMAALLSHRSARVRWVRPHEGIFQDADLANLNTPEDLQRHLAGPEHHHM
ncbi:MAG: molybdenum cofactor guanylyltransferase [Acidobacteria bacterium]|nr:molybdenum cofactor guanylyltransferase [Acidobacteriota bacterium]